MSEDEADLGGLEEAQAFQPEPVERESVDVGSTGTELERVDRDDRGITIYHWFLEGQISQPDAEEKAQKVFSMKPDTEYVQEDMFDSITVMMSHMDDKSLEERAEDFSEVY